MSQPSAAHDPWQWRASDADRDRYLAVLQDAYAEGRLTSDEYGERMQTALSAKTYADLVVVLQDLPVRPGAVPGPPGWPAAVTSPASSGVPQSPPPSGPGQVVAVPQPSSPAKLGSALSSETVVVSVVSTATRDGRWSVPADQQAVAIMGEVQLDLTSAVLAGPVTELRAFAIMGSVVITVPDAVQVEVTGSGFMGEFVRKDKRRKSDRGRMPSPEAPLVRIGGFALMGSVEVRTVRPDERLPPLSVIQQQLPPPPPRPMVEGPPKTDEPDAGDNGGEAERDA